MAGDADAGGDGAGRSTPARNGNSDAVTVVVDPGSWSFKCGVAGDDKPRVRIPSTVGSVQSGAEEPHKAMRVGRVQLGAYDASVKAKEAIVRSKVVNWEAFEQLLAFSEDALLGKLDGVKKKYMFAEGHESGSEDREKLTELLFEKFGAQALFAMNSAPLNLYACARGSGMVLDIGGDLSSASVVIDGFLQKDSVKLTALAGKLLTQVALDRIESERKIAVRPKFSFTRKTGRDGSLVVTPVDAPCHATFERFWKLDTVEQLVHDASRVSGVSLSLLAKKRAKGLKSSVEVPREVPGSEAVLSDELHQELTQQETGQGVPATSEVYTLPDGTEVTAAAKLGRELGELLFDPAPLKRPDIPVGIAELVIKSAQTIPNPESRKDLLANIVVCGGPSVIWGVPARISGEVAARSRGVRSRIIVAGPEERKVNAWIGGSIIGTLTSLNDLWVSRQDYEEYGPKSLTRKCP